MIMKKMRHGTMKLPWHVITLVVTLFLLAQTVSAFNVVVPNDTLDRYINHDLNNQHTFAKYSSVHEPGQVSVETFSKPYDFKPGEFEIFMDPGEYYVSWLVCPQYLTGADCARLPMISENQTPRLACSVNRSANDPDNSASVSRSVAPIVEFDPVEGSYDIGEQLIYPESDCCMKDMSFVDAVPTGRSYPSEGDWIVPYSGTRYYAKVTVPTYAGNSSEGPYPYAALRFILKDDIPDGSYVLHIQETNYDPKSTVEGSYGAVNAVISIKKGEITGTVVGASEMPYADHTITLEGYNFDSEATYLWITGPGLPECGRGLFAEDGNSPTKVFGNRIASCNTTSTSNLGFWQVYDWDPTELNLGPGSYKIYYSSVNPAEKVGNECEPCANLETGICGLLHCPTCGVYGNLTITFTEPEISAYIDPFERCCCPGKDCGTTGGCEEVLLHGHSEGDFVESDNLTKDLQLWMFGEGMIKDQRFLFQKIPYLCNGDFTYDLNAGLLKEHGISLCDLNPGTYYVVLQSPMYNNKFDVYLDNEVPESAEYVLSTMPVENSKEFAIGGPNPKIGLEALEGLEAAIDKQGIDDIYVVASFTIADSPCVRSVDFTADPYKGKAPLVVEFTGKSSFNATSWFWDFGDGTTSTEQNPVHTYEKQGRYTVSLTGNDAKDDPKTTTKYSIIVVEKPFGVDFRYKPAYINITTDVSFIDNSSSKPTSWLWDFGDGTTSPLQSPIHRFSEPGIYKVSLTVSDEISSSNTVTKDVHVVHDVPVADFTADPLYTTYFPATINFYDQSEGYVDAWNWKIVTDGKVVATSTVQNATMVISDPAIYNVSLTASNDGGSDIETKENFLIVGSGNVIMLEPGWNHISVPKDVSDDYNTLEKLFAGVDTGGIPYAIFDNTINNWTPVSNETSVVPFEAYRVYYKSGVDVITPKYISTEYVEKDLVEGWNGYGIPSMQPVSASEVLSNVDNWVKVLEYNPLTQRWEYPIINGVDEEKEMRPCVGYLVEVRAGNTSTSSESLTFNGEV